MDGIGFRRGEMDDIELIIRYPEIDVQGNGQSIANGDNIPSVVDDTDFGTTIIGTPITRTYTISNSGSITLTLTPPITVPNGFSIDNLSTTQIPPYGTTTLDVRLDAIGVGTFNGTLQIANDDSDENPYSFTISGTVINLPTPEIDVQGNGQSIANGDGTPSTIDNTDFGATTMGIPITRTYTIINSGSLTLTLIPPITVPTGFSISNLSTTQISPNGTASLDIVLDAITTGTFSGNVQIDNNDSDENPYTFTISGSVMTTSTPGYDSNPSVDSSINFGDLIVGNTTNRSLIVQETGNATLNVETPNAGMLTGPNSNDFNLTNGPPFSIDDGDVSHVITIQCSPSASGLRTATLTFATNDPTQPSVAYTLICTGINPIASAPPPKVNHHNDNEGKEDKENSNVSIDIAQVKYLPETGIQQRTRWTETIGRGIMLITGIGLSLWLFHKKRQKMRRQKN
jgi:hypothetical protein